MKAFVSWSSGKDCSYALNRFVEEHGKESVSALLHMKRPVSAHKVSGALIQAQADALGIELIIEEVNPEFNYTHYFRKALNDFREKGVTYGVFGDIYLESHREWIVSECGHCGITPIFPLWGMDVNDIYKEVINKGIKTLIIAIKKAVSPKEMLGEVLSMELYEQMLKIDGFDVCGENGEYHSFVFDAPLYNKPIDYKIIDKISDEKTCSLVVDIK